VIGFIEATELSAEQKTHLSETIAAATKILRAKAGEFGFDGVRALRKEFYRVSKHPRGRAMQLFDAETRMALATILGVEDTVLAAYAQMANKLALSFYSAHSIDRPHLDEGDYLQEATWAIFDAIYCYDGSTQLSTYLYSTIKKRLVGFVRSEELHSGIGRTVKALRNKIRAIMRMRFCNFAEAIAVLRETEEISTAREDEIRDACYNVRYVEEDEDVPARGKSEQSEEVSRLLEAIKIADFSDTQREMIERFLLTGERPDVEMYNQINPRTNQMYSRQALSQNWIKACEKLKEIMERRAA
jgi:DNA-directed RNA polymerase specialized sigma24 family protein